MKLFALVAVIFSTAQVHAEAINMDCIGEFPTTIFLIETNAGRVNVLLKHNYGAAYAPFWTSPVVPNDLQMLGERAEVVKALGKDLQFSFDVNDCKSFGQGLFQCFGSSETKDYGGHKVTAWGIVNSRVTEESMGQTFVHEEMMLATTVDDKTSYFTMQYHPGECAARARHLRLQYATESTDLIH